MLSKVSLLKDYVMIAKKVAVATFLLYFQNFAGTYLQM